MRLKPQVEELGTALPDASERGGYPVVRKPMRRMLKNSLCGAFAQ